MTFILEKFIAESVVQRTESLFQADVLANESELRNRIDGKSVLVIGGAGSIGSSFIKAVLPYHPSALAVVDINENELAELTRDLRSEKDMFIPDEYCPYPMDYSTETFQKMFRNHKGFDIVANFSAHKHVRSEKDVFSIEAMLNNNVLHLKPLLELLVEYPPVSYFCVSTDKAANPVNIMGASKRIMEDVIFSYSDQFPVKTARFANVAFSNGSLPAGFLKRIQKCQPLSAPNDVRRYFVSPREAGEICLLACILGNNREIFFPKFKKTQMVSFDEIARKLLTAFGFEVTECSSDSEALDKAENLKKGSLKYPVRFSASDTSGEKMFEEFVAESENTADDRFSSLGVIVDKTIPDIQKLNNLFHQLEYAFAHQMSKSDIVKILSDYLGNFRHIETGKTLDSKM